MDEFIVQLTLLSVLLILSAFFSGSETAFFSLNSLEKDLLRRQTTGANGKFVALLFTQPDEVLVTVLTGNMFVNIFASQIAEALGAEIFRSSAELVSIAIMTLLLLIFGEMTPKNLAIRHSLRFARLSSPVLRVLLTVLRPISYPLGRLRQGVLSAVPGAGRGATSDQSEAVLSAIRMGYQSKTIHESELRLLERFFRFRQKTAADVMTPRVDLTPRDASGTVSDLVATLTTDAAPRRESLIPVYKNDVDHIAGYVRRMDLVSERFSQADSRLSDIMRRIHAVPASKDLRELMQEMQELGTEMSVVVDEYGGTEGIVSFAGLIDYLFEDFRPRRDRLVEETGDQTYRVAGTADVEEVAATLNIDIESTGRTVAGLLLDHLGEFPEAGAQVRIDNYVFEVSRVSEHRIDQVEVRRDPE